MPVAAAIGAGIGAIGGALKSGPDANMYGRNEAGKTYEAYKNLVGKGPGGADVTASVDATRGFANTLNNVASNGLYDQAAGNRLAEQQFAGQRQALAQSIQDQMAVANRAASSAGRSTNDPILRARLGAEAMRQSAAMNAQQSSAAMDLGRQSTMDMLSLQGQRVNTLQGLAEQAFAGQQNLFGMGQNLFGMDMGAAQYENSRGGGLKGAITGGITGAGAGLQLATGFSNIANAGKLATAQAGMMNTLAKAAPGLAQMGANLTAREPAQAQAAPQLSAPRFGPSSPDSLARAGMINQWSYGQTFGPATPAGYGPPQFAAPYLNPYMNSAFFAK
jgi:hypothetical protein